MLVYHKIPSSRLKKEYFIKWHNEMGLAAALSLNNDNVKKLLFGVPRYMVRKFFNVILRYLLSLLVNDKNEAFYGKCKIIYFKSYFNAKIKMHGK